MSTRFRVLATAEAPGDRHYQCSFEPFYSCIRSPPPEDSMQLSTSFLSRYSLLPSLSGTEKQKPPSICGAGLCSRTRNHLLPSALSSNPTHPCSQIFLPTARCLPDRAARHPTPVRLTGRGFSWIGFLQPTYMGSISDCRQGCCCCCVAGWLSFLQPCRRTCTHHGRCFSLQ